MSKENSKENGININTNTDEITASHVSGSPTHAELDAEDQHMRYKPSVKTALGIKYEGD